MYSPPSRARNGQALWVTLVLVAASVAVGLSACGGDGEPSTRLLLEADLSELPAGVDSDQVMDAVASILEGRALAFGMDDIDIQPQDSNRLSVSLRGFSSEQDARELMEGRALLELRQPVIDEGGSIVCQAEDGSQFSITIEQVTYQPGAPGDRPLPRCRGDEEQTGDIVWTPPTGGQDQTQELPVIIRPASATVDRTGAPVVVVNLTIESGVDLEEITKSLIGLPLGIFLDDELLIGPTVEQPVTTGNIVIAGLSLREANILVAQLNAGALPVPVRVIDVEETSE